MSKSIITEYDRYCLICGSPNVECHHFLGGTAKRQIADADGVFAFVCPYHHNSSKMSVHQNKEMKVLSQQVGQLAWERHELAKLLADALGKSVGELEVTIRVQFINRYGKSYL